MIFDSYHSRFDRSNALEKGKGFVLSKSSVISKNINFSGDISIEIYGKNINGDGKFDIVVYYEGSSEVFKCRFSSSNTSKKTILASLKGNHAINKISINKRYNNIGRVELSRVIISGDCQPNFSYEFPKINVGVVVPYSIYGGGEIYIKDLIDSSLFEKEYSFHIMYMKKNKLKDKLNKNNIIHHDVKNDLDMSNYIIDNNIKLIIFYNSLNVYKKLKLLQLKNNFKLFEIYHSDFTWSDSMYKIKNHDVDCLIKISDNVGKHIISKNIKICKVPIDIGKFSKKDASSTRKAFGIEESKSVGIISRISKEKNLEYVIDLAMTDKNLKFYIVGDGPGRRDLERKIKNRGVKNIKMLGWINDVSKVINAFDALVLPSKKEGTPISILEGMAADIPCFCYPSGGIPELIHNGAKELTLDVKTDYINIKNQITHNNAKTRGYIKSNHCSLRQSKVLKNILEMFDPLDSESIEKDDVKIRGFYA